MPSYVHTLQCPLGICAISFIFLKRDYCVKRSGFFETLPLLVLVSFVTCADDKVFECSDGKVRLLLSSINPFP